MDYADGGDLRREIVRAPRPSAAPPRTARRRPAERLPTSAGALGHARPPLSPARGALEQPPPLPPVLTGHVSSLTPY